jgi:hypothetical protein
LQTNDLNESLSCIFAEIFPVSLISILSKNNCVITIVCREGLMK